MTSVSTSGGSIAVSSGGVAIAGGFYSELIQVFYGLRWGILFIAFLVFMDFWSGLAASVKIRGEKFRMSRAMRRSIVKFMEYLNFIIFGLLLSKACLIPNGIGTEYTGSSLGAIIVFCIEIDSIKDHICDLNGWNKVSFKRLAVICLKRFFVAWLKRKNEDAGEALEEALEEENKG